MDWSTYDVGPWLWLVVKNSCSQTSKLAECGWGFPRLFSYQVCLQQGRVSPVGSQASTCEARTGQRARVRCRGPVLQWTTGMGVVERGNATPERRQWKCRAAVEKQKQGFPGYMSLMPALRQGLHTSCMRKPQAQYAGSRSDVHCQRFPVLQPHCGDRARPDPPAHQPFPPTPAQLSGQKVGWSTGLGQQSREGQVPKASAMGTAGNPCQGQVPGGSRRSGMGEAKSPAGGNPVRTLPPRASGLSVSQTGERQGQGHTLRLDGRNERVNGAGSHLLACCFCPVCRRVTLKCHHGLAWPQQCWAPMCS